MQHRKHSLFESCLNTASGFVISYAFTIATLPYVRDMSYAAQSLVIVGTLTVVSVLRSYAWRRLFNRYTDATQ